MYDLRTLVMINAIVLRSLSSIVSEYCKSWMCFYFLARKRARLAHYLIEKWSSLAQSTFPVAYTDLFCIERYLGNKVK